MSKVQLTEGVYWVGAIDWNIRNFHGYPTRHYLENAYLIIDEKIALIDTVKAPFFPEDQILFSSDMFGQHLASSQRFDDEVDEGTADPRK